MNICLSILSSYAPRYAQCKATFKKAVNGQNNPEKHRDTKDNKPSCAGLLYAGDVPLLESLTAYQYEDYLRR